MRTLRGITWDHTRGFDPMIATSDAYAAIHPDIKIVWERRSLQAFADRPIAQMANDFDLMVIDHPHVGEAARDGLLAAFDVPGNEAKLEALDSASVGPSHKSYRYDGHQWALAIDAAAPVAAWRPDKIDAAPRLWSEVLDLARDGRVVWAAKPVDALMSFFNIGRNRGFAIAEGDRLIDSAEGHQVLADLRILADNVPDECFSMNPIEVFEWMSTRDDKVYCPFAYGYSNYAREGFRPHLLKFCDIPDLGGMGPRGSCIGGTGIAVSASSRFIDTAMDYAFYVASEECQSGLFFDAGGQPAHAAAWESPRINSLSFNFFAGTRKTLEMSWLRPRYAGYLKFQDEGGTLVNRFLKREIAADETLEALEEAYLKTRDTGI